MGDRTNRVQANVSSRPGVVPDRLQESLNGVTDQGWRHRQDARQQGRSRHLRGGIPGPPNYSPNTSSLPRRLSARLARRTTSLMVDCSHGKQQEPTTNQPGLRPNLRSACRWRDLDYRCHDRSNINAGRQGTVPAEGPVLVSQYGAPDTDACIDWDTLSRPSRPSNEAASNAVLSSSSNSSQEA
ncbi:3-deoxy-7-phosphoheptulonate synthase [Ceratobasidium sp. AG-Ba]|nr:3-deoxy-7-phosphoheptulonate synthase [Ceratobasidium sp. AG-Ba]